MRDIGVVALWALVLPFINSLVEGENPFKADEPYSLGGGASIVPIEGVITVIRKGPATLTVVTRTDSSQTVEEGLQVAIVASPTTRQVRTGRQATS